MARPKKILETKEIIPDYAGVEVTPSIAPITEHFNIGDLNTLRDKINEIIKALQQ